MNNGIRHDPDGGFTVLPIAKDLGAMKITIDRALLEQALEALGRQMPAHAAMYLREALAQPQQEPLFKPLIDKHPGLAEELRQIDEQQEPVTIYQVWMDGGWHDKSANDMWMYPKDEWDTRIVYTSPPARKPLSADRIGQLWRQANLRDESWMAPVQEKFARAIEAAHEIKP